MKVQLLNKNILIDDEIIYSFSENSSISKIETIDIELIKNILIYIHIERDVLDIKAKFKNVDVEYIDFLINELVKLKMVSVVNEENFEYSLLLPSVNEDEFIKSLTIKFKIVDEETIFNLKEDITLIIIFPINYKIDFINKLSDFLKNSKIKTIIFGLTDNLLTLGPILDSKFDTASLICYYFSRLSSETEAKYIHSFYNANLSKLTTYSVVENMYFKLFIEYVNIELLKIENKSSKLLSLEIEIDLTNNIIKNSKVTKSMHFFNTKIKII